MAYTTHGHQIPGTTTILSDGLPRPVARCGGVKICTQCKKESQFAQEKLIYRTGKDDLAKLIACETSGLADAIPEQEDLELAEAFLKIINGEARHSMPRKNFFKWLEALS